MSSKTGLTLISLFPGSWIREVYDWAVGFRTLQYHWEGKRRSNTFPDKFVFQTVIHFEESFLFPGSLLVSGLWSWRYGGNYPLLCKVFGGGEVFRSYSGVIDMNPVPECELFIQSGEALVNLPFWLGGRDDEWRRYSVSAINKCREVG